MGSGIGSILGDAAGIALAPATGGASMAALYGGIGSLAGGALGGALGGNGGANNASTVRSAGSLPSWLQTPYQQQVNSANSLAAQPYNPAFNQQVAGFNPQQTQAFNLTNQLVGQYQQPYQQALSQTGQLGQQALSGLNNPQFQSYMNPYIQDVLNTSNQQAYQNYGIAQNQLNEQAAGAGAFGNDRFGLAQGQLGSNFMMNLGAQQAGILNQGFGTALQGYQSGINQGIASAAQLGNLASGQQAAGLQGMNALYGAGAAQQQLQQSQLNAAQQNALQQAQYPWQQLMNAQSVMHAPASQYGIQNTASTPAQLSPMMQGLQTAQSLNGAGLGNAINQFMSPNVTGLGNYTPGSAINYGNYQSANLAGNGISAYDALQSADNSTSGGFLSSIGNFFSGLRPGGVVPAYAKGGAINPNDAPGAPEYWHQMSRGLPREGFRRDGFRKGGLVDPGKLSQGIRSGGLLHKAPKGKAPKMPKAQGLAMLQALSQLSQQPGMGQMPQVGAQNNPIAQSFAAPGAQQPQIGMMIGGQIPKSLGYRKGGVPMKMEQGVNGCYADGGFVNEPYPKGDFSDLQGMMDSHLDAIKENANTLKSGVYSKGMILDNGKVAKGGEPLTPGMKQYIQQNLNDHVSMLQNPYKEFDANEFNERDSGDLIAGDKGMWSGAMQNHWIASPQQQPNAQAGQMYRKGGLVGYADGGQVDPLQVLAAHISDATDPRFGGLYTDDLQMTMDKLGYRYPGQGGLPDVNQYKGNMPSLGAPVYQGYYASHPDEALDTQMLGQGIRRGGIVGYDNGGNIDPYAVAASTPGNLYSLGDQIAFQRANNFVNQMLGQNPQSLPTGYRRGGVMGYDDGGMPANVVDLMNNPPASMAYLQQPQGSAPVNLPYTDPRSEYNFIPSNTALSPLQNFGNKLSNLAEAADLKNAVNAVGDWWNNPGYFTTPENQYAQQSAMPRTAAQAQAAMAAVKAQEAQANPPTPPISPQAAGVTPHEASLVDALQAQTLGPQQPQGPMGLFGAPMNLPAAAFASGMTAGAGHGNSGALAAGVGAMEEQAMRQRQFDALTALRGSQIGLNQAKAQSDLGGLALKQQIAPWQQQLKEAQATSLYQRLGQTDRAEVDKLTIANMNGNQGTFMNEPAARALALEQLGVSSGAPQQQSGMFGQQGLQGLTTQQLQGMLKQ